MSQENVEVALALIGDADVDLVPLVRDDASWAAAAQGVVAILHPDFEIVGTVIGTERPFVGIDGLREFLLDWLAPWEAYRSEVVRTVDPGDQVVTIFRIFGRREGSTSELESSAAWTCTIRDGKVARIVGYADPDEALKAVGLEE
ncbi:MAG TPA: nuclear transport factor 2 family protein [Solirubrobacteraceae bacterium]|nr:nuclear transport factor 2 family protein [Solirubrobacteraceae bacterium]